MEKGIYWIILIAVGVFIGTFAYDRYQTYQAMKIIEQWNEETQQMIERENVRTKQIIQQQNARKLEEKRQRELEQQRQARMAFNQDTLCAINSDSDKCVCMHRTTGKYVSLSQAECKARAEQATDRL